MYETDEEIDAFFSALCCVRKERVLGVGQFGLTILAMDETEQIEKVFKLPRDERATEALKAEGRDLLELGDLHCRNIAKLHEFGRVEMQWKGRRGDRYYLCLAFGGTSLRQKLGDIKVDCDADGNPSYRGSGKRLPLQMVLRISIDVCQGLAAAHGVDGSRLRLVNRNVTPENILIDDATGVARIASFDLAGRIDPATGRCSVGGVLLYLDPDGFLHGMSPSSDLYMLGVVMYEMATGQLPFGNFPSRLHNPPVDPRRWNEAIPEDLSRVILRAMENNLSCRYSTAAEMLAAIQKVVLCPDASSSAAHEVQCA